MKEDSTILFQFFGWYLNLGIEEKMKQIILLDGRNQIVFLDSVLVRESLEGVGDNTAPTTKPTAVV